MTARGAAELRQDRDRRKRTGVFYTPEPVARYMVTATLRDLPIVVDRSAIHRSDRGAISDFGIATAPRPTILDPACGEGALLWAAYQFLCDQQQASTASQRLDVARRQLFGVDLDDQALARLRQRFRDDLAGDVSSTELNDVLQRNFPCGNAVNGSGWESPSPQLDPAQGKHLFHWNEQFADVNAAGGFDIVIANPPYRRERGAKSDRDELEQSPLARSRRQARMDLWHYFFHRSLDLLRPGGVLTFIVNSYWTTSHAGRPLIDRMLAETTPLEFVLLDTAPVFAGVGGRHLIVRLRKGITAESCRIIRLPPSRQAGVLDGELWQSLAGDPASHSESSGTTESFAWHTLSRDELFQSGRLNLESRISPSVISTKRSPRSIRCLGDLFEVRQGIAENPPRVTRRQAEANSELRIGEGVFVLSADELANLELSPAESELVQPYYTAAEITRFWSVPPPRQWLLYLTRHTAPDLTKLPHIERHLARFRPLLEQRREVRLGKIAWWHLHWPRESRLFELPRILAVQMAKEPRFAYVEAPTYVGFSVNVIVERAPSMKDDLLRGLSLEGLAVILNSQYAATWFDAHAKRRGVNLDITGSALKEFPVPEIDESMAEKFIELGRQHCEIKVREQTTERIDRQEEIEGIEERINELFDSVFHGV